MNNLPSISKFVDDAINGIKSIEEQIIGGTAVNTLERNIWAIYKDCESAVFLVKLEISDVEASDNTSTQIVVDRPEHAMNMAGDHLVNVSRLIREGKMIQALEQLRTARNIMAEIYARIKRENLRIIRESHKNKERKV
jgi:hypothetical protein